jgi:hypothetical protein
VLIDECGDQLWLNAVSCGDGDSAAAASTLLNTLDFVVPAGSFDVSALHGCEEMHFVDRKMAGTRLFGEPTPVPPPGKTFVHGGRPAETLDNGDGTGLLVGSDRRIDLLRQQNQVREIRA